MLALETTSRNCVYCPGASDATPRMSWGPSSFFRLQVRLEAAGVPANGTVIHPPSPSPRCALTSENVTWSAVASPNGVSVIMTRRLPVSDGPDGDPLHAIVIVDKATATMKTRGVRMQCSSPRQHVAQKRDHACGGRLKCPKTNTLCWSRPHCTARLS